MMDDDDNENPVDAHLSENQKRLKSKWEADHQLWRSWVDSGKTPEAAAPLFQRFSPLLDYKVRQLNAPNVSLEALRSHANVLALKAFDTWDPSHASKASLQTHVENNMRKLHEPMRQYQNLARISGPRTSLIGPMQRAHDTLYDQLGRAPTHEEMAQHIRQQPGATKMMQRVTPKLIADITKQTHFRDVFGSQFESDPVAQETSRLHDVRSLIAPVLTEQEQQVYQLMEQGLKPGAIAKKVGVPGYKVSRLQEAIRLKISRYL